jgi:hypothetical protein
VQEYLFYERREAFALLRFAMMMMIDDDNEDNKKKSGKKERGADLI